MAQFIKFELPTDFVAHLRADHDAIVKRNEEHREDNQEGVASTTAIGVLLKRGNETVTHLDTIMRNKFARNPEILRKWESASHLERAPQRDKKPEPPETPKAQA